MTSRCLYFNLLILCSFKINQSFVAEKFSMPMAALMYKWLMMYSILAGSVLGHVAVDETPAKHPFYVSVTEINHNATDKTLEIDSKLFAEDLEQILEKNYKTTLDITSDKDKERFDQLIADYFSKHLSLSVNGGAVALTYVGYEVDKESAHCYFQVDHVTTVSKMDINNSILYDFIDSQMNIMHVTVNGKRKSTRLTYPDRDTNFSF
jgi:hypothetical protein